jgi:hypothetical protein
MLVHILSSPLTIGVPTDSSLLPQGDNARPERLKRVQLEARRPVALSDWGRVFGRFRGERPGKGNQYLMSSCFSIDRKWL